MFEGVLVLGAYENRHGGLLVKHLLLLLRRKTGIDSLVSDVKGGIIVNVYIQI
jgi:hypothetical protein